MFPLKESLSNHSALFHLFLHKDLVQRQHYMYLFSQKDCKYLCQLQKDQHEKSLYHYKQLLLNHELGLEPRCYLLLFYWFIIFYKNLRCICYADSYLCPPYINSCMIYLCRYHIFTRERILFLF